MWNKGALTLHWTSCIKGAIEWMGVVHGDTLWQQRTTTKAWGPIYTASFLCKTDVLIKICVWVATFSTTSLCTRVHKNVWNRYSVQVSADIVWSMWFKATTELSHSRGSANLHLGSLKVFRMNQTAQTNNCFLLFCPCCLHATVNGTDWAGL